MTERIGPLDKLIEELGKLPGIGQKSAARLAFFLLKHPENEALALAEAIIDLKKNVRHCRQCFNVTTDEVCYICADARRDRSTVCIVEQPQDLIAIERTAEYRGLYHVLLGSLSPINDIGPDDLTIEQLVERIRNGDDPLQEAIIATNPTNDGEATATYLADRLEDTGISITQIAQGLPVGSSLEHADNVTMARSILMRRPLRK